MVAISGFMVSKEASDIWDKQVGSIIMLPKEPSYYSNTGKYPNLSASAAET